MKKRHLILFLTIAVLLTLIYVYQSNKNLVKITFRYENGRIYETVKTAKGEPIPSPDDPVQKNGLFIGWFTTPDGNQEVDLSQGVWKNTVLYARFRMDGTALVNDITQYIMKSVVKIECRTYSSISDELEAEASSSSVQGSGFCFSAGNGYYYILTNCHAVCKEDENDRLSIRIYDYKGNRYIGYLYNDPNKMGDAISPEHDLACVYFTSESSEVMPLSIAMENPSVETEIFALGAPASQMNSITFGKITDYKAITLHETPTYISNVTFPVICHSATTRAGSSGGPLMNGNLQVVGVHFAGNTNRSSGYAIPAESIWDFLLKYIK